MLHLVLSDFSMDVVGIDLGYGETKIICPDGSRIKFPSRWKIHENEAWGFGGQVAILSLDGGPYFTFGDSAFGENTREPLADGRLSEQDSLPLLASALWMSGAGERDGYAEVVVASGTPLGRFPIEIEQSRSFLAKRNFNMVNRKEETRDVKINRVVMRPQGVGAALYLLDQGLIKQEVGCGLVVDIGSRTTDVLAINLADMEPIVEMSFTVVEGVGNAISAMSREIARETGYTAPNDIALAALTREVNYRQRIVGGRKVGQPIIDFFAGKIIDKIRSSMRGELDRVTALIPVGGGSRLIGKELEVLAPGTLIDVKDEDKQYANVLGYYDAAKRMMKGSSSKEDNIESKSSAKSAAKEKAKSTTAREEKVAHDTGK